MFVNYSVIEIFTSEKVRYHHLPVAEAIIQLVQKKKVAGRCYVSKGTGACYETGEFVTQNLLELSFNMPVKIEILLPSADIDQLLPVLEDMVEEGVISVREVFVYSYKTRKYFIPGMLTVGEVMTANPRSVTASAPLDQVASLLLSSSFTGVPVVDNENRPIGIITQGDLLYKADMPLRIGLLNLSDRSFVDKVLQSLSVKNAAQVMTTEVITVSSESKVTEAVHRMIDQHVKRLPVVDQSGKLVGMISRVDIFRTITKAAATDTNTQKQKIIIQNVRSVSDIMQRDTHTVLPDASVEDVLKVMNTYGVQRVAVADQDNRFRGLISDRHLLMAFSEHHSGIWDYLSRLIPFSEKGRKHRQLQKEIRKTKASEIMETDLRTVHESTAIDEAIRVMTENGIKRLPVLDENNNYKGMISRESILCAGFTDSKTG
jgi:CBS domain-containing protein